MHKILGYLFICIGVLGIFFAAISMYKVFVDRQPVAPVVQLSDMNVNTQYGALSMPMQNINTLANLGLFALFMMFVLSAGSKLSLIGVNLVKTERLREALLERGETVSPQLEQTLKKL